MSAVNYCRVMQKRKRKNRTTNHRGNRLLCGSALEVRPQRHMEKKVSHTKKNRDITMVSNNSLNVQISNTPMFELNLFTF